MAKRHELLVARKIGKAERPFVQHFQKALRPAAMLDVRPARRIGAAEIEVVALGDELREIGGEAALPGHMGAFLLLS